MPRNIPSVHCVPWSRTKLIRMRGENCVEANVSVISSMAKTIETTVIVEVAMALRIDLRHLRVLPRREQRRRHPCPERRDLLFQRGQHAADRAQHQRDDERPDQEAAAQPVGDSAEQQRKPSVHGARR